MIETFYIMVRSTPEDEVFYLFRADSLSIDIKPNNILINYDETVDSPVSTVTSVQVSDLEDTVIVPSGKYLRGALCGNQLWRSPESWARAPQNQASDVFSFGIVVCPA